MSEKNYQKRPDRKKTKKMVLIITLEAVILVALFGAYRLFFAKGGKQSTKDNGKKQEETQKDNKDGGKTEPTLTPEQDEAAKEQERLKQEEKDRTDLVAQADRLAMSYDYDGAIELIKTYKGAEGGYDVYPTLKTAIEGYEATKGSLVLYGGSYTSPTQFNHIFFHSLVADTSKAFDGDDRETGYNMYMTTISEFNKIIQKMYDDGYVLISIHDFVDTVKQDDGTTIFKPKEFYLPQGKKPFVLSQDDVCYYPYMDGDGFASRIVIGDDGKVTTEMKQDDGSVVTGAFDMVPLIDEFVEAHPDFSYKGAKGIIALTGYEGIMGYRTNDPTSPTYEQDKKDATAVADAMKAEGWEFASHGWGHRNALEQTYANFKKDTDRWLAEVEPLIGPTDIYIFPYGVDFETTMGHYVSDKFKYMKQKGFNFFCGVDKAPWMHFKDDYIRMTRRPLDGQAMIQFPERVADLFDVKEVLDPARPPRKWD